MHGNRIVKILDIYVIRRFIGTFFYTIALLSTVVVIFDISERIHDFLDPEGPTLYEIIFDYYMNYLPYLVNLFSSLFTFITVIFFTSKMAADTEIIAILNSGLSFNRFLRPYIASAVLLALLSFYISNFVIPHTNKELLAFQSKYVKNLVEKRERNIHLQIDPKTYVYVENFNLRRNRGNRFSMERINKKNELTYKLTSDYIKWDSASKTWSIHNYHVRKINGFKEKITKGKVMDTTLNLRPSDLVIELDNMKTMGFWELRDYIEEKKMRGVQEVTEYEVEKHKRIAFPFSNIILTLMAVSLSSRKPRRGVGTNLGIGFTLAFSYILIMQVSSVFGIYGNIPPIVAVWIPNLVYAIIALFLLKQAPK
ncbi:MAG: LptF/LptG family permease [Bacteroidales bacterium]|nr:LptF/LptG family permease [Bacteroidales bacterium]